MGGWVGVHFLPFYSPNGQKKIKIKEKIKKERRYHLEISSFYTIDGRTNGKSDIQR